MSKVINYPVTFYRPAEVIINNSIWYIQRKTELVMYDNDTVTPVANMDDDLSGVATLYVLGNPGEEKWIDITVDGDIFIRWTDEDECPRSIHVGVAVLPEEVTKVLQIQYADKTSGVYL